MSEIAEMAVQTETGTAQIETALDADLSNKKKEKRWKRRQNDNSRFTKKKFPKGKVILILLAVGIGVFVYLKVSQKGPTGFPVTSTPLEKGDLISAVNLTGTIESANDAEVYAKTSGIVQTVKVEVGDRVEAGQLLAQLDTRDVQLDIQRKQVAIEQILKDAEQAQQKSEFALRSADKNFDAARVDIAAGLNQDLIAAENAVDAAQRELNAARRDLNTYKDKYDEDLADKVFKKAQKDLDRASDTYWKAKAALEDAKVSGTSGDALAKLQKEFENADKEFEKKKDAYNAADREYGSEMSAESRTYRNARNDYEKALKNRDAIKNAIARQLDDLKDNIEETEISAPQEVDLRADYLDIEKLQQQIADSTITAPISGTVTAVYAKEGASASGLLFIIEDMDSLIVKTAVKELDVGKVKPSMKAEVKADATGEKVFPAQVQTISPTSKKDAEGNTVTSGNVEFETDVALTEPDSDLRVGMNVRINIVTEEKKGVWSAPFDAVVSDAEGNNMVYTVETDAEGISRAKAVPVTTGMETDFYVEISGEGLRDGMPIISDPSMLQDGMEVLDPSVMAMAAANAAAGTAADTVAG